MTNNSALALQRPDPVSVVRRVMHQLHTRHGLHLGSTIDGIDEVCKAGCSQHGVIAGLGYQGVDHLDRGPQNETMRLGLLVHMHQSRTTVLLQEEGFIPDLADAEFRRTYHGLAAWQQSHDRHVERVDLTAALGSTEGAVQASRELLDAAMNGYPFTHIE